jgi:hypothetical protein
MHGIFGWLHWVTHACCCGKYIHYSQDNGAILVCIGHGGNDTGAGIRIDFVIFNSYAIFLAISTLETFSQTGFHAGLNLDMDTENLKGLTDEVN